MTPAEAAALLGIAAAFDNRKPDPDAAQAWAIALNDLRFADCRDAIVEHYRRSSDWLMPEHVIAGVKRIRRNRVAAYGTLPAPTHIDPDDTAALNAWTVRTTRDIADGNPPPKPKALPAAPEPAAAPKALRDQLAALRRKTEIREGLDEGETA